MIVGDIDLFDGGIMNKMRDARDLAKVKITCEKHGEVLVGFFYHPVKKENVQRGCEQCADEMVNEKQALAEKQIKDEIKKRDFEAAIGRAAIPKRFKGRTFDNYFTHCVGSERALRTAKKYVDGFDKNFELGVGLVIVGSVGTGKTHLAVAIANELLNLGYSAHFCTVMSAVRRVKDTWNAGSEKTETQAIEDFLHPDLLILDEVGVQFGSDTEKLILFEILNRRYEEMLPTILLSNLGAEGLKESLGERVVDRMRENGALSIKCEWESYRSKVKGSND